MCQFHKYFSSSFFCTKVFCTAFLCLQFGFVIFWQKEISAKAVRKLLVKLAKGGSLLRSEPHSLPEVSLEQLSDSSSLFPCAELWLWLPDGSPRSTSSAASPSSGSSSGGSSSTTVRKLIQESLSQKRI